MDDPKDNQGKGEEFNSTEFFISICCRAAEELRQVLKIDEQSYKLIAGYSYAHPRDYYLYGVLDEVEKAGIALIRYKELISDDEKQKLTDRIDRNVLTSTLDEQALWVRKLTEILIEVLLFRETNSHDHFRHYLLVKEHESYKRLYNDFKEFFAVESRNIGSMLDWLRAEITRLQSNVSFLRQCWYLRGRKSGLWLHISDFQTRLKGALKQSSPSQKLVLGLSYERAYSGPSRGVHANVGGPVYTLELDLIEHNIGKIGLLAAHILLTSKLLVNKRPKGLLRQLSHSFTTNKFPNQLLRQATRPGIKKGDFVLAYGDLAEVVQVKKSSYGYRAFRVKYLQAPPLPGMDEDEFAARYVQLLVKRGEIAGQVRSLLLKDAPPHTMIPQRTIYRFVREAVVTMWNDGILQQMVKGSGATLES